LKGDLGMNREDQTIIGVGKKERKGKPSVRKNKTQ